jgi:hypothetical protein
MMGITIINGVFHGVVVCAPLIEQNESIGLVGRSHVHLSDTSRTIEAKAVPLVTG